MNKKLYQESIILIGPSGAGKSSVAEELHKITGMPRLCLDKIANAARDTGVKRQFQGEDEFNCFMISKVLERTKKNDEYGIVDFGAGHSVYDDILIFEDVKEMLQPFQNIVLLLPSQDEQEALEIMKKRSTGDTRNNQKFFESPCNKALATMTIYENGRTSSEVAEEIISKIKERKESKTTSSGKRL